MFVSSDPDEPSAAFLKLNEALGADEARIRSFVQKRYLVRTRADIATVEARNGDTRRRDSTLRSERNTSAPTTRKPLRSVRVTARGCPVPRGCRRAAIRSTRPPVVVTSGSSQALRLGADRPADPAGDAPQELGWGWAITRAGAQPSVRRGRPAGQESNRRGRQSPRSRM